MGFIMKMKDMDSKQRYNKIAWQVSQIAVIILFFTIFFTLAKISTLYADVWSAGFRSFVNTGMSVSMALLLISVTGLVVLRIKSGAVTRDYKDITACALLVIIHYLIRVQIVGTLQLDEGLTCYESLEYLLYHPDMIITDFINAGKIADRSAYGYSMFALMGEFLVPGRGTGFQWIQLYMGLAGACCIYMIFKKLFPKARTIILFFAALVVSFSPMQLGMSTLCGLEYGMTMFFIYALYCCVSKKYILMVFWLIMLGTTKSSGMLVALCFAGAFLLGMLITATKAGKKDSAGKNSAAEVENQDGDGDEYNLRTGVIAIAAIAAVLLFVYGVIRVCAANRIAFSGYYIRIKLAQLYVLNFNWIWLIIVLMGIVMVYANMRVRRTHRMEFTPWLIMTGCYIVYVLYLLAYPKATLPRYNMLADTLLAMFGVIMLIKLFERRRVILSTLAVIGALMLCETFVTIDPVSASLFTNMETNRFPILYTAGFSKDEAQLNGNLGDYGYYNYHYTFVNEAIDSILCEYASDTKITVASSADEGETQFRQDDIKWDKVNGELVYHSGEEDERYVGIERVAVDGILKLKQLPERLVYIEIPWNRGDSKAAIDNISTYYQVDGPKIEFEGSLGTVLYYFFRLKDEYNK